MTERNSDGNVIRKPGFSQVVVWCGTIVGDDIAGFEKFFKDEFGAEIQYLEEILTKPDMENGDSVPGTGGRNDVFFAVSDASIPSFSVRRFELGDVPRWIEDVYGSGHGDLYDPRVALYKTWNPNH